MAKIKEIKPSHNAMLPQIMIHIQLGIIEDNDLRCLKFNMEKYFEIHTNPVKDIYSLR